jgi:hypothetical protein
MKKTNRQDRSVRQFARPEEPLVTLSRQDLANVSGGGEAVRTPAPPEGHPI